LPVNIILGLSCKNTKHGSPTSSFVPCSPSLAECKYQRRKSCRDEFKSNGWTLGLGDLDFVQDGEQHQILEMVKGSFQADDIWVYISKNASGLGQRRENVLIEASVGHEYSQKNSK
jgi:hypothetical protein